MVLPRLVERRLRMIKPTHFFVLLMGVLMIGAEIVIIKMRAHHDADIRQLMFAMIAFSLLLLGVTALREYEYHVGLRRVRRLRTMRRRAD
jgi:hypothetical protein